jgi:1-acyl-sn-glycerol-3-phosphate acyltransferase
VIRPDRVTDDGWYRFFLIIVRPLFRAFLKLRVEGLERIPGRGPALLAANHVSPLDPVALCLVAAQRGRTLRLPGAAEVWNIPVIGWALRRLKQIPVRRGMRDRAAIDEIAGVIAAGSLAGIHPEGRLGTGEAMLPFKSGMARLALAAKAPVVPIGVWGMQRRWPVGGLKLRRPWRPVAAVVIGEPIEAAGSPENEADVRALTERAVREIESLIERAKEVAGDRASLAGAGASESPD